MATKNMKRSRAVRQQQSAPYSTVSLPEPMHPTGTWAADEHDRFLEAMKLYPKGPWKAIADHVVTRSVRQVQTHAQKYQEKVVRRMRGLRKPKRKGEESDEEIGHRVVMGTYGKLRKRKSEDGEHTKPTLSSPTASQTHTDKESMDSDSNDESDTDSLTSHSPKHTFDICVSSPLAPSKVSAVPKQSFTSLLEEPSPIGADCINLAPLHLSELSPGWLYLDEITDKTIDLIDDKDGLSEVPAGLPTLGESLDFFIEYLSIVN